MADQTPLSPEYLVAYSGQRLIAVAIAFVPILIAFVSIRFYSRHLSKTAWGLDDYLVIISLVLQIGASALAICFVKYGGVGRHFAALEQLDPDRTIVYFKYLVAVSVYYFSVVAIPKLAILALYLRLFTPRPYRLTVYVLFVIVVTTGIVTPITALNLCRPFAFNWNRTIPGGKCLNENAFYRWGSLPNIITDVAMLILPMPIVWRLHISKKLKVGLTIAFLTGSVGLATSILRFTSFFKGSAVVDGTWASVDLMTWTLVEPDVYLIAACLPTYRPVLAHLLKKTGYASSSAKSGYKSKKPSHSDEGAQHISPKLPDSQGKRFAGFHRFSSDVDSLEEMGYGETVRLARLQSDNTKKQTNNTAESLNQIIVQNDFDVSVERKA